MTKSLRKSALLACLLCAGFALHTQAASVSYPTTTPIPTTLTDWSLSLSFPQFDPSLGTLLSVELDLSATFDTEITVTNSSPSASNGTAKTEVQLSVQDGGSNLSPPQLDLLSPTFPYSLGPGGSTSSGPLTQSGTSNTVYTLPAILAEFTGLGSTVLSASTFTQTLLANTGGNTAADQVTSASLTGTVIYNYVAVPEPGTVVLFGLGALGLLVCRRVRRTS